ncbi:MAG: MATE family efflux transporter [Oligoflexus sp.]
MPWSRLKVILAISLPIMGGMVSQNILNLIDIFFVRQLGDVALAAAGISGFASFTAVSIVLGFSTGVQAIVARRYGEGQLKDMARPLNAGIVLALAFGIVLTLLLWYLTPVLFPLLNPDPAVQAAGIPYLQVRLLGTVFLAINYSFRGYWNGIGRSGFYLTTLLIMHFANAVFNYVFIFGHWGAPELGLQGAAWGTSLAFMLGSCIYLVMGWHWSRPHGFLASFPSWQEIQLVLRISMPSSIQQLFFSAGILAFHAIIGLIGTPELAASNILINLLLVALLPGMGLGLAAATLVGQAMGRKDLDDASRWAWQVAGVGLVFIAIIAAPMVFFPSDLLQPFSPDATILAIARLPLIMIGLYIPFDVVGVIFFHALLGAGDSHRAMLVSLISQWLIFLPCAYLMGPIAGGSLALVWALQCIYRLLQGGVYALLWRQKAWAKITF